MSDLILLPYTFRHWEDTGRKEYGRHSLANLGEMPDNYVYSYPSINYHPRWYMSYKIPNGSSQDIYNEKGVRTQQIAMETLDAKLIELGYTLIDDEAVANKYRLLV